MKNTLLILGILLLLVVSSMYLYRADIRHSHDTLGEEKRITDVVDHIQPSLLHISATKSDGSVIAATGVIVTADGGVMTSQHIVSEGARYMARLPSGDNVALSLITKNIDRDLAFFRIQSPDKYTYQFASLVNSQAGTRLGKTVLVFGVGNFGISVVRGIVSSLGESIEPVTGPKLPGLIQLDASVQPGMSGGPTVGLDGSVIGITTALSGGNTGRGWATPVTRGDLEVFQ